MGFAEDLAAAKVAPVRSAEMTVELDGKRHKIRFYAASGTEYAAETLKHPPRIDVPVDVQYGYNLSAVTAAILPKCGRRLEGDVEVVMDAEEWGDLLSVLDGGSAQELINLSYTLNEYASAKAASRARKVLSGSLQN